MRPFSRILSATAAAGLLVLAVPLSAQAADPYTPLKPDTWQVTIHPGTVVTHNVPCGTFDPSSTLQLSATGVSPAPTLAVFAASQLGATQHSDASGCAQVKLNFGPTTRGVYEVTLAEPGTQNTSYGVVTVVVDPAVAASRHVQSSALARTGTHISSGIVWGAGAAVVAGIAALWAGAAARRRRSATSGE
jgi:hypothetical protein